MHNHVASNLCNELGTAGQGPRHLARPSLLSLLDFEARRWGQNDIARQKWTPRRSSWTFSGALSNGCSV